MNNTILEEAISALAAGPMPLAELHERLKTAGSSWSKAQHHLFFLAFDGFVVDESGTQVIVRSGTQSPKDRLRAHIIHVVDSFSGKPVTVREIRKKLPGDYVTSDEQVKAVAKISEDLEILGPGLIRKK